MCLILMLGINETAKYNFFVCFGRLADVSKVYSNLNNKVNLLEK